MCYAFSLLEPDAISFRYAARFPSEWEFKPMYYMNAFDIPSYPVLTNQNDSVFQMMRWGLIPFWVKKISDAESIRVKTMNARSETLFEKPSFKFAIQKRRCLIPADGFFEWRFFQGRNYPYYIQLKDGGIFSFAGIWENWNQPGSNEVISTFSIITCDANTLLAKIHNKKKRMPVILPVDSEMRWLDDDLSKDDISDMLVPFDEEKLKAFSISRLVSDKTRQRNVEKVIEPFEYQELPLL